MVVKIQFVDTLVSEVESMVNHASGKGLAVPPAIVVHLYQLQHKCKLRQQDNTMPLAAEELVLLSEHHSLMTSLIEPALPATVTLMKRESDNPAFFSFLGAVPLVRRLSAIALCFLLMIVLSAVSPQVNSDTINQGLFASSGLTLLLNQCFLIGCSGLGATFSCLYQVNGLLNEGTYEQQYDSSYWTQVIMGLMGGLIICEILPLNSMTGGGESGLKDFDKPIAALMGGFSSDLIYRLLNRVLEVVGQLFDGPERPLRGATKAGIKQQLPQFHLSSSGDHLPLQADATGPGNIQMKPGSLATSNDVQKYTNIDPDSSRPAVKEVSQKMPSGLSDKSADELSTTDFFDAQDILSVGEQPASELAESNLNEEANLALPKNGLLTWLCEGREGGPFHSRKLHVPSDNSGLTIGRGYDLKEKRTDNIITDFASAGLCNADAEKLSKAAGLQGKEARQFVQDNQLEDFEISHECQLNLFELVYQQMEKDVRRICDKPACAERYGSVDWNNLQEKIKQTLVDLRYRGDYTPKSREKLQGCVADNDLAAFSAVIADRHFWQNVPSDRFNKRASYLQDETLFNG